MSINIILPNPSVEKPDESSVSSSEVCEMRMGRLPIKKNVVTVWAETMRVTRSLNRNMRIIRSRER